MCVVFIENIEIHLICHSISANDLIFIVTTLHLCSIIVVVLLLQLLK